MFQATRGPSVRLPSIATLLLTTSLLGGCSYDFSYSDNANDSGANDSGANDGALPCGNGALDTGEACDDQNTSPGDGCSATCEVETGWQCSNTPSQCSPICGDALVVGGETCDGTNVGTLTCADYGFYSGSLACSGTCDATDTSGCSGACGDGQRNGPEVCDTTDFGGVDCVSLGYLAGTLSCSPTCDATDDSNCSFGTLIFSEYVEGTGNNKALEVYNASPAAIDLATCQIVSYNNGVTSPTSTYQFPGSDLAASSTFVVCNTSADASLVPYCDDQNSNPTNFNGDDARELQCGGVLVDSIGRVGEDPGTEWGTDPITTVDYTLRRAPQLIIGDTNSGDPFDPATEWLSYPVDTFDGLGLR
ncbi:MAG: lamin tail domain-containing protein [bacterium]